MVSSLHFLFNLFKVFLMVGGGSGTEGKRGKGKGSGRNSAQLWLMVLTEIEPGTLRTSSMEDFCKTIMLYPQLSYIFLVAII